MKFFIALLSICLFLTSSAHAKCLMVNTKDINLRWTAYKTPAKAGVKGTFKKISITGKSKAKNLLELLNDNSFSIDGLSVNSKHPARDKKLASFVFSTLKNKSQITGKLMGVKKDKLSVSITMNGVTKKLPLKLSKAINENSKELSAKGHLDMFDFMMQDEVSAINKACLAKHEGKTWSDVALSLKIKFSACK